MEFEKEFKPPNFLIGGTAAGGTSYLSNILVQHPEIYLPTKMRPEPHYFYKSWEFNKGPEEYLSKWFRDVPVEALAVGERTSSYLFGGRQVAERIFHFNPGMKLIFTLRNPIERTWANYRYTVLEGLEDLDFTSALDSEEDRIQNQQGQWAEIQPHNYTGRGFYGRQLLQFLEFFPRKNILILKSELLSSNLLNELDKIYDFLQISKPSFKYKITPNHTSLSVRDPLKQMQLREYFQERFDIVIEAIRREESLASLVENNSDLEMFAILKSNLLTVKNKMKTRDRSYLQKLFSSDIKEVNQIIDFDTSDWI